MKQQLVSAFSIGFIIVLLFASCSDKKVSSKHINNIDSLTYYTNAIQQKEYSAKSRIKLANSGLSFSTKTTDSIIFTRFKFLAQGALKVYESAINTSEIYLKLVNKIGSKQHIAYANASIGYYSLQLDKKERAFQYYSIAKKQYVQLKDTMRLINSLVNISSLQKDFGDYSASEQTAINALNLIGDNSSHSKFYLFFGLASNSRNQNNYKEAIYWNNKALEIAKTNKDSITTLQNKSLAYRDLKQYAKSIAVFDSLLQNPIKRIKTKARIIDNLAYTKWLQNKHNSSVIPELKKAENIRTEKKDWNGLNASYAHLSDVYALVNSEISHDYALKMLGIATQLNSPEDKLEALQKLIKTGKSPEELKKYYNSYTRINDSLKIAKQQQQHSYAKLKFDTEKNRADNLKLSIENTRKDLAMAEEKTRDLYVYFAMGTLVISIIGISKYRRKEQEKQKREEIYKTETRISKRLHDEVANEMVHVMNKVQYTNQNKEALLDDLQNIYLLTRNISHQNSRIKGGIHFENELKNMLDSFSNPNTNIILKSITKTDLKSLKKDLQREIFRILQELMVNMQKHSKASLVVLSFDKKGAHYTISYADNGQGTALNTSKIKNGLSNMESRIKNIDGTITFESEVGKGFKSIIRFKK